MPGRNSHLVTADLAHHQDRDPPAELPGEQSLTLTRVMLVDGLPEEVA